MGRECMMSIMILCQYAPEVCSYGEWETKFKAKVVMKLAPPKVWIENLKADWEKYCKMFADNGDTIDPPPYPYTAEMLNKWLDHEDEIEDEELRPSCRPPVSDEILQFEGKRGFFSTS